jgi:hypothetical protein
MSDDSGAMSFLRVMMPRAGEFAAAALAEDPMEEEASPEPPAN